MTLSAFVLISFAAVVASGRQSVENAPVLDAETMRRKKELLDQYNLATARKKGAIDDALNFLVNQESQEKHLETDYDKAIGTKDTAVVPSDGQLPLCQVSVDTIGKELTFTFNNASKAPYDHHCWLMRTRYNVAEVCDKEEQDRSQSSLWQWQWGFSSALKGIPILFSYNYGTIYSRMFACDREVSHAGPLSPCGGKGVLATKS